MRYEVRNDSTGEMISYASFKHLGDAVAFYIMDGAGDYNVEVIDMETGKAIDVDSLSEDDLNF